jgi:hypothetical protein
LREALSELAGRWPTYGYRRLTVMLIFDSRNPHLPDRHGLNASIGRRGTRRSIVPGSGDRGAQAQNVLSRLGLKLFVLVYLQRRRLHLDARL